MVAYEWHPVFALWLVSRGGVGVGTCHGRIVEKIVVDILVATSSSSWSSKQELEVPVLEQRQVVVVGIVGTSDASIGWYHEEIVPDRDVPSHHARIASTKQFVLGSIIPFHLPHDRSYQKLWLLWLWLRFLL